MNRISDRWGLRYLVTNAHEQVAWTRRASESLVIAVPQVSESYNTNATLGLLQRLNTRLYSKRIKALALLCSGCFAVIMYANTIRSQRAGFRRPWLERGKGRVHPAAGVDWASGTYMPAAWLGLVACRSVQMRVDVDAVCWLLSAEIEIKAERRNLINWRLPSELNMLFICQTDLWRVMNAILIYLSLSLSVGLSLSL